MAGNVLKNLEALGCTVNFLHGKISRKKRIIDERSKQQLLRIDNDEISDPITIDSELPAYDAIVISDYNKGTVSYELVEDLRSRFKGPIFIDTKKTDLARFNGCYVKINQLEKKRATSLPDDKWLIVTHGSDGATWNKWVFPAEVVGDVTDVTGAGDTFLAAFAYEFLIQEFVQAAVKFAIRASGITVQHVGVYAPRLDQLL
jgi:D-beta-D-heptose 7-phosphate kinase/D-beta-D-heptose 1-phosphate adenosyltransferase